MRRRAGSLPAVVLALFGLAVTTALAATSNPSPRPAPPGATSRPSAAVLASRPLSFEPAGDGGFVSRGPGYSVALSASEAVVGVDGGTFRLRPAGPAANPAPALVAGDPLGATVTRLAGDDPSRWTSGIATYGRVDARQVWPGVDMVWQGDQRRLRHDMVVAPGADPGVVAFDVDGATSLTLDPSGDLVVDLGGTTARLARPVLYQDVDGRRRPVSGAFALLGPSRIGFRVGPYDPSRPLVIDPTLVTSTLLGGGGNDSGYAVAVDAQGNVYVTGSTESTDFPSSTPLQAALANAGGGPTSDVFVSKLSPDGSRLAWSTYLGGRGRDTGYGIAVGADGGVYVTGVTESDDFPRARAGQDRFGGGASDAFAAKLAASGTALEWSTFVGGSQTDRARGIAVDASGTAYVTGSTNSVDFPAVTPFQPGPFRADDLDAFLVKVPSAGGQLSYATRLGGSNDDRGLAVAVDGQGDAYLTGDTLSPGFPTVKPIQASAGGSAGGVAGSFTDAFVTKFNPNGSALVYSTFLGGGDVDQGTSIGLDGQGAAYVAGNTNSPNFPTVAPLQAQKGNDADAFVTKVDPNGAAFVYSTYVGGSGADGANAIAVDRTGNAAVAGTTGSPNWPTNHPVQAARAGAEDAFLLRLDAAGRSTFSSYLGGRDSDAGMGVALDGQGAAHVLGLTSSADFPTVKPLQGARPPAGGDAFVASLDLTDTPPTTARAPASPASSAPPVTTSASSSNAGHDRRVLALALLTFILLVAAVLQTLYLRRRPAPAAAPGRGSKPAPKPATAGPGVKVLGDTRPAAGATASAAAAKAAASKSARAPKARGGPKSGPYKAKPKTPAAAKAAADAAGDDGGPPTVAVPAPPRPKRQEPVITQLLAEDLWAPEPEVEADAEVEPEAAAAAPPAAEVEVEAAPEAAAPEAAVAVEPAVVAEPEAPAPAPGPEPAPAIPPVPAADLSFWDLFPEDLPPARSSEAPVEDLLIDQLALPEGPDSNAGRLIAPLPREPEPPPPPPAAPAAPPPPPEAEIVIAELLDGPPPTGLRPSAESPWAAPAGDDIVIDELLADRGGDEDDDDDPDDDASTGQRRPLTKEEQARIAADRARRRRARRSGRRK